MAKARTHDTRYWHPFAPMGTVRHEEVVIDRGEDVWVWDESGNRYLDATASLWYAMVGHGRTEIADAAAAQMRKLEAYSTFGDLATRPTLEVSERLAELAPVPDARVLLVSGGADAIDTAAKLARRYWHEVGQPERLHLISRTGAYHGTHGIGTAMAGIEANRHGHGPMLDHASVVPHDDAQAVADEIDRLGPETVAAVFAEPVIGAGGLYPPREGYIERLAEICRETGVLLVIDSVICAFGRLGSWFGVERFGIEPDMITFAKGVTSGYLPLGGVIVSGKVAEPFWSRPDAPPFRHGPTYAGHPTCCAAALANMDLLEREGLVPRGAELESDLLDAFNAAADHPLVAEARGGVGFLAALELDPELMSERPAAPIEVYRRVREHGVLVRSLGSAIAVSPPLTATPEHLELITEAISRGLDDLQAERSGKATAAARG